MITHLAHYRDGYPLCWEMGRDGPFEASHNENAVTCPDCINYLAEVPMSDASEFVAAWDRYFANHPEVLASWAHQNGRWPNCECRACRGRPVGRRKPHDPHPDGVHVY